VFIILYFLIKIRQILVTIQYAIRMRDTSEVRERLLITCNSSVYVLKFSVNEAVCVCVYVCMCVCVCVRMCVRAYVSVCERRETCMMYECVCECVSLCVHV